MICKKIKRLQFTYNLKNKLFYLKMINKDNVNL